MRRMKNDKGFTLAELLIVVAIIAVLVAVSIPIFMNQLEKSREATDIANFRAAKAAFIVAALDGTLDELSSGQRLYYHADSGIVDTNPVTKPYGEGTKNNPYDTHYNSEKAVYPRYYEAGADYTSAYIYAVCTSTEVRDTLIYGWDGVSAEGDVSIPPAEKIDLTTANKPDIHVDPTTETNTTYP